MNLALPPDTQAVFDDRATALLPLVVSRSAGPAARAAAGVPDAPRVLASTPAADAGVVQVHMDPEGHPQACFLHTAHGDTGLEGAGYRDLRLLAEDLQARAELRPHLSVRTVESGVFWWVLEHHAGRSDLPLLAYLLPRVARVVVERVVFVPVFGLVLDGVLSLGRIALRPLNQEFFDRWDEVVATADRSVGVEMEDRLRAFRHELQGSAAAMLRVDAEPVRAHERALEETEHALALLRVFQPHMRHPLRRSYLRPRGCEAVEHAQVFVGQANPTLPPTPHPSTHGPVEPWILDRRTLTQVEAGGLRALRDLSVVADKTPFQQGVLDAVLRYARSSVQPDVAGRLLWVMAALEAVLVYPAQLATPDTIAERLAVVVSPSPEERRRIRQRVVAAYAWRDRRIQHPPALRDIELLAAFLSDVFRFFVMLIGRHQRYPTPDAFLAALDPHPQG